MIAFLKGIVTETTEEALILDVNGVGYEVFSSSKTLEDIAISKPAELWIYTYVREDVIKLFGFLDRLEKRVFLAFIGINGIGPKMALAIISATPSLNELLEMIEKEDVKGLVRLPRVGKKSAQQIILSLKGQWKMGGFMEKNNTRQSVTSALLNLGFKGPEIQSALDQIKTSDSMEEDLKQALSYLQPLK